MPYSYEEQRDLRERLVSLVSALNHDLRQAKVAFDKVGAMQRSADEHQSPSRALKKG